jgi:hypothetical protein
MNPPDEVFFDSHGSLWTACKPDHPDAEAFGPHGTSRRVFPSVVGLELDADHRTPYAAAIRDGRVYSERYGSVDLLLFRSEDGRLWATPLEEVP